MYTTYALNGLKTAILLTGLAIVFIWKRENSKPTFIKVIWVLLCLADLADIVFWVLVARMNMLRKDDDFSGFIDIYPY